MARGGSLTRDGKRLLLLSLVFPPDAVSTAQLFGEVVEDLVEMGWEVVVVTTKPHYNPPPQTAMGQELIPVWGALLSKSTFRGANVLHTAMPLKGPNTAARIGAWVGFHVLSVLAAAFEAGKVDVILAPSPPLSIGVAAWFIGLLKRAPYIYNVQELYPDTAVSLGALRDGPFLGMLRAMERFVYKRAFAITTIAPGMARSISARTGDPSKVRLIPNFVDTRLIAPRPRDNAFAREYGLVGRFSVVYAGNMGPAQDLGTVLEAAQLTEDNNEILYVFVGDGTSRNSLQQSALSRKLSNVLFIPQQPYDRVPDIYGASDLCIVPLASNLMDEAVPSKVYRIMAAGRRVLAIAEQDSDLSRIVRDSGGGIVVKPGNADALAKAIVAAANDSGGTSGELGREYVSHHVDRPLIIKRYSDLLWEAVKGGGAEN